MMIPSYRRLVAVWVGAAIVVAAFASLQGSGPASAQTPPDPGAVAPPRPAPNDTATTGGVGAQSPSRTQLGERPSPSEAAKTGQADDVRMRPPEGSASGGQSDVPAKN